MIYKIGIIIRVNDKFLILKRNPKIYVGWGLITGKVERNEDLLSAAVRELKEETGICINPDQIVNTAIETSYFAPKNNCYVKINWFTIDLPSKPVINLEAAEWLDYKFVTLEEARDTLTWPTELKILEQTI